LQKAYPELEISGGIFPVTEAIHREVLSLPMGPHLSDSDVQRTIDEVKSFKSEND
jgi:dTDP-4-amino-4,6-dideoxygalactose transaminase